MQNQDSRNLKERKSLRRNQVPSVYIDALLFLLALAFFTIPPLFFIGIKQNEWVSGFIPIRMVNAELKLCAVIIIASLITGIIWIRIHLKGNISPYPKSILFFSGIFILSILLSTSTAHNIERAWVSSFIWHFLPLLFVLSLVQLKWSSTAIIKWIFAILIGGVLSSLIVMDQHYLWTDWSHRLPRAGFGGLIYNQNFAAEYHAPLLPIALGVLFFVRSRKIKLFIFLIISLILFPALSLSLARGAWVGLMGGCGITATFCFFLIYRHRKNIAQNPLKKAGFVSSSFLILALILPLYLYTSDYWKKGAFSNIEADKKGSSSSETTELKYRHINPCIRG